jgi:hypothetical protein
MPTAKVQSQPKFYTELVTRSTQADEDINPFPQSMFTYWPKLIVNISPFRMSDAGDEPKVENTAVAEPKGKMSVEDALQVVFLTSFNFF